MKQDETSKKKNIKPLQDKQTTIRKQAMIDAMKSQMGIITKACKASGVDRSTFYRWYHDDEDFKAEIDSVDDISLDFVEGKLYELINEKNVSAIIFHLKCRGKKRGYYEKAQLEHTGNIGVDILKLDITKIPNNILNEIIANRGIVSDDQLRQLEQLQSINSSSVNEMGSGETTARKKS